MSQGNVNASGPDPQCSNIQIIFRLRIHRLKIIMLDFMRNDVRLGLETVFRYMPANLSRMANTVNKTLLLNALFLSSFELDLSFKFHLKI